MSAGATEAQKRKTVQDAIDGALFKINELEVILANFDGNNELVHAKLNEYVDALAKLYGVRDGMVGGGQQVDLAVELLRAVDEGTNPDTFTLQLFKDSLAQNQTSKGKVEAFRLLQQQLTAKMQEAFPSIAADYQQLRAAQPVTDEMQQVAAAGATAGQPQTVDAAAGRQAAAVTAG